MVTFPSFGSSRRLIWLRLVFIRSAKRLRERFCAFIASAICQASTSLMATASNSSSFPSSFRKSSSVVSPAVEREAFFFFISASSWTEFSFALTGQAQVLIWRLLGLLDEAVKDQEVSLLGAEQYARDPVARQIAPQLP